MFKTDAVPVVRDKDKKNFHVGYFYDATKNGNDLHKVLIKFPKKVIDHASCVKHLEVTGHVASATQVPGTKPAEKRPETVPQEVNLMYPDHDHTHGWHGRSVINQTRSKRSVTTTTSAPATTGPSAVAALSAATLSTGTKVFFLLDATTRKGISKLIVQTPDGSL